MLDAVYRSITDHAIYMVDPAGIVLTWSLGAESVKGWREEEVMGKDFAMFYSAEEIAGERPRRDLEQALAQGVNPSLPDSDGATPMHRLDERSDHLNPAMVRSLCRS